jgi:hypothetical protein
VGKVPLSSPPLLPTSPDLDGHNARAWPGHGRPHTELWRSRMCHPPRWEGKSRMVRGWYGPRRQSRKGVGSTLSESLTEKRRRKLIPTAKRWIDSARKMSWSPRSGLTGALSGMRARGRAARKKKQLTSGRFMTAVRKQRWRRGRPLAPKRRVIRLEPKPSPVRPHLHDPVVEPGVDTGLWTAEVAVALWQLLWAMLFPPPLCSSGHDG